MGVGSSGDSLAGNLEPQMTQISQMASRLIEQETDTGISGFSDSRILYAKSHV
jgi:hypothetical protein